MVTDRAFLQLSILQLQVAKKQQEDSIRIQLLEEIIKDNHPLLFEQSRRDFAEMLLSDELIAQIESNIDELKKRPKLSSLIK